MGGINNAVRSLTAKGAVRLSAYEAGGGYEVVGVKGKRQRRLPRRHREMEKEGYLDYLSGCSAPIGNMGNGKKKASMKRSMPSEVIKLLTKRV